jgi:hypothetical protein
MRGRPSICNHAIVVHHRDAAGVWWGIEGRPGGVGWRDLTEPLKWATTNANNAQPKSEGQRYLVATAVESMLDTPYDWGGIVTDAQQAARWLWKQAGEWQDDQKPAAVVCSSLADWAYEQVGLPNPGGTAQTRMTTPGDWDDWMIHERWTA